MKIKDISLGIVSLCLVVSVSSCDDFLKEEPKQNMDLGQYYKTGKHAYAGVNQLYNTGLITYYDAGVYNGATIAWGAYLSGMYDNNYKGQEVIAQYSQELSISAANIATQMNSLYTNGYRAISRANTALKYIPGIEDPTFSTDEKNQLIAQAKFFRAFNYFHLVKFFGDVPLITEPYESLENIYVARTASSEIYNLIIQDLEEAIPLLANNAFVNNGFRIAKTTAETLLANVYLQMSGYPLQNNQYAAAAATARSIIKGGKHSLTQHQNFEQGSAYNIIRTNDNLPEYIFTRERTASISDFQSRWTQISFPSTVSSLTKYTLTNNAIIPVAELRNIYDPENDLRIQEKQYLFSEYTEPNGTTHTFDEPSVWFYLDEEAMFETGISGRDFPIYRYAEVLLIAAEAIARSEGVTAEAVGYLADVRARAYTKKTRDEIVNSLSGLSVDAFVEEVWTERTREFIAEFKLWDDIQRTRKYPVTSENNKGVVTYVDVIGAKNPWNATFQEKHLLWPISDQEMQRNPSLVQNPGYE